MRLKDGQGFARRITLNSLQQFAPLLARRSTGETSVAGDDEQNPTQVNSSKRDSNTADAEIANVEKLFAGKRFNSHVPFTPAGKSSSAGRAAAPPGFGPGGPPAETAATTIATPNRGKLRWQKVLSATDAQRQYGNPTGDIRLTQAKWTENGRRIDQTTYFRNVVFRQENWQRKNADVEEATVEFVVNIMGVDYGRHKLVVSHKPSGEASQSNYTTGIQWGELMSVTQQNDLTGRTLQLFDFQGDRTAFVLEIV